MYDNSVRKKKIKILMPIAKHFHGQMYQWYNFNLFVKCDLMVKLIMKFNFLLEVLALDLILYKIYSLTIEIL